MATDAMIQAAYLMPSVAVGVVLLAYVANRLWVHRGQPGVFGVSASELRRLFGQGDGQKL